MKEFSVKQVIVIRKDLNMRKGKIAAQVAHASLASVLDRLKDVSKEDDVYEKYLYISDKDPMYKWLNGSFAKIVVSVDSEEELKDLITKGKRMNIQVTPIIDSGNTEFHGVPTLTGAAFGPEFIEKIDELTKHLKLI